MTHAPKAASVRLGFAAFVAASGVALLVAVPARTAEPWSAYVAPIGTCAGAEDPGATAVVQRRAITCLVNWARNRAGSRSLLPSRSLRRAAAVKGLKVIRCGRLTHAPCGSDPLAPLRASGYPYASFGENLLLGPRGQLTARQVVAAWLESPPHRANVLRPGFRNLGAALVGKQEGAVWVTTFASPR
jgi:uncharacterized protein YkwD